MRRVIAATLAAALLVPAAAEAHDWRGYGGYGYRGGYGGGYGWHHHSSPWPFIAGGVLGLGVAGALLAPRVYVPPPPVYYAPPSYAPGDYQPGW
jgi:opacity protein-like surface antigen